MDIHEYQAKEILKKYEIPTPAFAVASTVEEAKKIIDNLDLEEAVLKVQIHAGGRGKAGGVKIAKNKNLILKDAAELIGKKIINNQTGPQGLVSHKILISPLINYQKEYYLSIIIDRRNAQIVIIASPEGGMDIEEISEKYPKKILKMPIYEGKLRHYQILELAKFMGWTTPELLKQTKNLLEKMIRAFLDCDSSLLEINPLVLTNEGTLLALDAKLSIDDNALFRQPFLKGFYDPTQVSEFEVRANQFELAYIALNGNIGCMVNGAGLAMATMDIIKYYGGMPANFLDVGGGASREKVAEGFKILLSDPQVKTILVNIFGGIMNCATLAEGIVSAARELQMTVPLVVRMEGTNVEQGRKILKESGLKINIAQDLTEAAQKAVQLATQKAG